MRAAVDQARPVDAQFWRLHIDFPRRVFAVELVLLLGCDLAALVLRSGMVSMKRLPSLVLLSVGSFGNQASNFRSLEATTLPRTCVSPGGFPEVFPCSRLQPVAKRNDQKHHCRAHRYIPVRIEVSVFPIVRPSPPSVPLLPSHRAPCKWPRNVSRPRRRPTARTKAIAR